jgi:hypothetical protein
MLLDVAGHLERRPDLMDLEPDVECGADVQMQQRV